MSLSSVLAIATALALTYTIVSMLASTVKEGIAAKLQWRAKDLERGILSMLQPSKDGAAASFDPAEVYSHPLVRGLAAPSASDKPPPVAKNGRPSYLPARNFTLALVDVLCKGSQAPAFTAIESTISDLPDGDLKTRLLAFANEAGGDIDALKSQFDKWFDDTMDRISGAYKRRSQVVLLIIGVVLAGTLNVDTIAIVGKLEHDTVLQEEIAAQAQVFAAIHQDKTTEGFQDLSKQLDETGIPIGWDSKNALVWPTTGSEFGTDIIKLFGLMLTALAVSLGAPFWFDLLNQLVSLRSTGPKPPRADDQTSSASASSQ